MKLYVIVLSAGRTGHVPGACTIAVHALVEMLRIPGRQPDTMTIMIYDDDDGGGGDDDDDEEEEEKDDDFALEFAIRFPASGDRVPPHLYYPCYSTGIE